MTQPRGQRPRCLARARANVAHWHDLVLGCGQLAAGIWEGLCARRPHPDSPRLLTSITPSHPFSLHFTSPHPAPPRPTPPHTTPHLAPPHPTPNPPILPRLTPQCDLRNLGITKVRVDAHGVPERSQSVVEAGVLQRSRRSRAGPERARQSGCRAGALQGQAELCSKREADRQQRLPHACTAVHILHGPSPPCPSASTVQLRPALASSHCLRAVPHFTTSLVPSAPCPLAAHSTKLRLASF